MKILDIVLIANEIVDKKRCPGDKRVVFKIEFKKTYDHANWDFLDHTLERKGFNHRQNVGCLSLVSKQPED